MPDAWREQLLTGAMARYQDLVFRLARSCLRSRADAEDVLQEVFLRYYRAAPSFHDEQHERAWLIRVTINLCRSVQRSPWRRLTSLLTEALPAPESPEEDSLIALVHRLSPALALTVHLHYYEDYSVEEIAQLTGVPSGTVKSRLARGREQLRRLLETEKEDILHEPYP